MARDRIDELADVLLKINQGQLSRAEAQEVLSSVGEVDLSLAEQRLLERGTTPQELQGLCKVHLEVLDKQAQDLKVTAGPGHPIHTLVSEHELILGFLDSLEAAARVIRERDEWRPDDEGLNAAIDTVRGAAFHLVETEKHHAREEQALFRALEARGITVPTRIMRLEHADLRPKKHRLYEISEKAAPDTFLSVRDGIADLVDYIVPTLREHIMKENTILYPAALQAIRDAGSWREIKSECDDIGYCCFTPAF